MGSVLRLFWNFLPAGLMVGFLALIALVVILTVLRIVAKVLDAIPFL